MLYKRYIKRLLGIFFSIFAIVISLPILLCTAVLIKIDSKGPVIFKQKRLGLHGEEFTIFKFRTMKVNAEKEGTGVYSYADDPRVTKAGRIIRNLSIDELPQLFNILKGDMGFVGMRPPLTYHPFTIDKYSSRQKRIFNIRPGITGWAQVNGRNSVDWSDRIEMNLWYENNVSFLLDVKILFLTAIALFKRKNVIISEDTSLKIKQEIDNVKR